MKRVHDAPDGAEEADERGGAGSGGEKWKQPLQSNRFLRRNQRQYALEAPDIEGHRFVDGFLVQFVGQTNTSTSGHLRRQMCTQLGVANSKHTGERRGVVLFGGGVYYREAIALGKDLAKQVCFTLDASHETPFIEDDSP